jgi:crotonobetainyl-CoA:carnitine CoA-transferase CaiB-like acyl-CoA transferase
VASVAGGFLDGVRVIEIADELGEYAGKLLAGLGAEVIKIEPPGGEVTRRYGPFYQDRPGPDRSLCFWHYNLGKRGVVLDLDTKAGQDALRKLAQGADVLLETRPTGYLNERGLGFEDLKRLNPALIYSRISAFGDDGPWAKYKGSDLVHLALGGMMMNCGYSPQPSGEYDTPPIAPQMWQAYHIAGEMSAMAVLGALIYRLESSKGQYLATAVHDAVSKNTEGDLPNWIYAHAVHRRQTCRHSLPGDSMPAIAPSKDGRWLLPYYTYLPGGTGGAAGSFASVVGLLKHFRMQEDLEEPKYREPAYPASRATTLYLAALSGLLVGRFKFADDVWKHAQERGLAWAPLRLPEENLADEHWQKRETFFEVEHPELGRSFTYTGAKWFCTDVPWQRGPRAPLLGEHTDAVLAEPAVKPRREQAKQAPAGTEKSAEENAAVLSKHGKPFALRGVRVIDLSWFLASAGSGRFLAALGAEVIKVEHESRYDPMRFGTGKISDGGRAARERASAPLPPPGDAKNPNRSGTFLEINAGKRSLSLNLKHAKAKALLTRLIADADMVIEGYSPGAFARMGFSYDNLRKINPAIIYVQQSGFGERGVYGSLRSYGPVAQAFSGLSEMSGLAEPYAPAGIGYSYLDWFGAYNMAVAMLSALYRKRVTGEGCYIDSSQVETGIYLTGASILDFSANGRHWKRYGNASPYKPAAPHGAYRCEGTDRWIAIGCFSDEEWSALVRVLGAPAWCSEPRFATLEQRLANQAELDRLLNEVTLTRERYALMDELQRAGVPAGVCQTAQDRFEHDPQLKHLQWLVELTQRDSGTWPVKEFPVKFSETPPYMGGFLDRHGPSYAQDNDYVLGELLGLGRDEIARLKAEGVL